MTGRKVPETGIFRTAVLIASFGFVLAASVCRADEPLVVTLVSEVKSIQPGHPFYLGLQLHHGAGYHSYWKYPGIVGVPSSIDWKLPDGFTAGEIEWPAPERVFMHTIGAQGFERDVILPIKITPPADVMPGQTIAFSGRSGWMACAKRCTPGFTDVAIALPVMDEAPALDERLHALFGAERARVAHTNDAWKASASEQGKTVTLTMTPSDNRCRKPANSDEASHIIFFTTDGWIDSDEPQTVKLNVDGSFTITLKRSDVFIGDKPPASLNGILRNEAGWLADGTLVSLQISASK